jgi:hypothetical protein
MLFGLFYGIFNYNVYISGSPEHTTESRGGPIYNPVETPGDPGRRESATTGWIIAGIGLLLIVSSMFISIIVEFLKDAIGKLRARTGERQHIRKGK